MNLHEQIHTQLLKLLNNSAANEQTLNSALRLLAKYRSALLQNTLIALHGTKVMAGPFAGMEFVEQSAEGCHMPKLLGCYEEELHAFVLSLPQVGYETILNIGCAEGYYAVGLKRMAPNATVVARDINPVAQSACRSLAAKNGVALEIGGVFAPGDFADFVGKKTLVWCDIEGAERELLDMDIAPELKYMDLVVEFHPTAAGHTFRDVLPRFKDTHDIEIIYAKGHVPLLPPFLQELGYLDQLLAQWEWRSAPTPWAVMRAKNYKGQN